MDESFPSDQYDIHDDDGRKSKARRHQVKNACLPCRKAHAGCDNGRPCSRCVKFGIENTCVDKPRKKRASKRGFEDVTQGKTRDHPDSDSDHIVTKEPRRKRNATSRRANLGYNDEDGTTDYEFEVQPPVDVQDLYPGAAVKKEPTAAAPTRFGQDVFEQVHPTAYSQYLTYGSAVPGLHGFPAMDPVAMQHFQHMQAQQMQAQQMQRAAYQPHMQAPYGYGRSHPQQMTHFPPGYMVSPHPQLPGASPATSWTETPSPGNSGESPSSTNAANSQQPQQHDVPSQQPLQVQQQQQQLQQQQFLWTEQHGARPPHPHYPMQPHGYPQSYQAPGATQQEWTVQNGGMRPNVYSHQSAAYSAPQMVSPYSQQLAQQQAQRPQVPHDHTHHQAANGVTDASNVNRIHPATHSSQLPPPAPQHRQLASPHQPLMTHTPVPGLSPLISTRPRAVAIWRMHDRTLIDYTEEFRTMLGYTVEQMKTLHCPSLFPPQELSRGILAALAEDCKKAMINRTFVRRPMTFKRASGEEFNVDVQCVPQFDAQGSFTGTCEMSVQERRMDTNALGISHSVQTPAPVTPSLAQQPSYYQPLQPPQHLQQQPIAPHSESGIGSIDMPPNNGFAPPPARAPSPRSPGPSVAPTLLSQPAGHTVQVPPSQ